MTVSPCLVVSTMRDEGPYLLEWLAYHRVIGFTDFLIYSGDCRDGSDLLLDRLQANGVLTHVREATLRRGTHKTPLEHARAHRLFAKAAWAYLCDADEFLNIRCSDGLLEDLIERFPSADAIQVAGRAFSNGGYTRLGDTRVTEVLTECEPEVPAPEDGGRTVRTLFRPGDHLAELAPSGPGFREDMDRPPFWGAAWLEKDPDADPRLPRRDFGYEIAQVNHYAVRSVEAFLLRRDRGAEEQAGTGADDWARLCRGGETDATIQRHLPALRDEMARLMADPVVRALHHGTHACHELHLRSLLEDEDVRALRDRLVAAGTASRPDDRPAPSSNPAPGAPKRHRNRLRMLEQMPKRGRCAEVGVWKGWFSQSILDVTTPTELVLIDPWDLLAERGPDDWTHEKHGQRDEMVELYRSVETRYGARDNVTVRRGFSADVLAEYPDGYFDWVYIDGNHLYDAVRTDLDLAFRKVRSGGIVAGDDFFWKRGGRLHVREAVLDTMRDLGIKGRPTRIGQQFMIEVPA